MDIILAILLGILFIFILLSFIELFCLLAEDSIIFNKIKKDLKKEVKEHLRESNEKDIIYIGFYSYLNNLKEEFDKREEESYRMIEYLFPAPQITNNKFTLDIKKIHEEFYKRYDKLNIFFETYPVEDDISLNCIEKQYQNLKDLKEILEKNLEELSKLVLEEDNIEEILEEMEEKIDSIKNYGTNPCYFYPIKKKQEFKGEKNGRDIL